MATRILFVYGTLKRGLRNHNFLLGQDFLGEAQTALRYRLYDRGSFPCMVENPRQGVAVRGELWRVDEAAIPRLDEFEEVPDLFSRREIHVVGFSAPVFAYLYQRDIAGMEDCGDSWPKSSSAS
jgi:gamma-glutamylcyclotransferase (GGCT)/AIG2-like uncharacterized protein YtfP